MKQRRRTRSQPAAAESCPDLPRDPRALLPSLRPLAGGEEFAEHAARCPDCFDRAAELLLLTAPPSSDPGRSLLDGLAHSLYELAKAVAGSAGHPRSFRFDETPPPLEECADGTERALEALAEYTDGSSERSGETRAIRRLIADARRGGLAARLAREALDRALALGGAHGLDAANLLGFLALEEGDLERAERMFRTVVEHAASSRYERETQAHAMNNLAGVLARRDEVAEAILWAERSLLAKERHGLDTRTNWINLLVFWLRHGTAYGVERSRASLRALLALEGGRVWLEGVLAHEEYAETVALLRSHGLDREFPEIRLPRASRLPAEAGGSSAAESA